MKLKYILIIIIGLTFLNISCTNRKYQTEKQPAPDTSENPPVQHQNEANMQTQSSSASKQTEAKSKYEFPDDNGIGPIKEVKLGSINKSLVEKGEKIFKTKCVACHQLDTRLVGPPLRNVTKKNTPEFIMNYLLNTTDMQKKDPIMKKLVDEYKVIMPDQQLTKDDAREILEYLRSVEK